MFQTEETAWRGKNLVCLSNGKVASTAIMHEWGRTLRGSGEIGSPSTVREVGRGLLYLANWTMMLNLDFTQSTMGNH